MTYFQKQFYNHLAVGQKKQRQYVNKSREATLLFFYNEMLRDETLKHVQSSSLHIYPNFFFLAPSVWCKHAHW